MTTTPESWEQQLHDAANAIPDTEAADLRDELAQARLDGLEAINRELRDRITAALHALLHGGWEHGDRARGAYRALTEGLNLCEACAMPTAHGHAEWCRLSEPAPATTPNLIGQEIGSLPDEVVNAIVRDPNDPRYPAAITVYCDRCHVERQSSYIVHDKLARAERLAIARAHMRTLGWVCDTTGDHCPDCHPADTGKETDR